ncbi:hypothetical protein SAMN05216316_0457 [Nitrosovibrio sp. Nv6]|nr:hypothetical protein SAMN05216316_0457 [Nitrosovibrio sp. Nv6]
MQLLRSIFKRRGLDGEREPGVKVGKKRGHGLFFSEIPFFVEAFWLTGWFFPRADELAYY